MHQAGVKAGRYSILSVARIRPMANCDDLASTARRYEQFAAAQAHGKSPVYEALALAVCRSPALLSFLAALPSERRQPNLFLAAVRMVTGVPHDGRELEMIVRENSDHIKEIMLSRTTQTNEPARCAVLLPVFARLPQPLALIEVGASAGLCLLPDRYGYDFRQRRIESSSLPPLPRPVFPCIASPTTPLPTMLPQINWRCGLDLNPLDVKCATDMTWLETLVWPGQEQRAKRLREAIAVARADPPKVYRGDLRSDLPMIARSAPKDAQLVVFHTAVLGYVGSRSDRNAFAGTVRQTGAVWISNEAPDVFPEFAQSAPPPPGPGHLLLAVDGKPVAWTAPHGQSIDWFTR